jgi:hypothetical protein
MKDKLTQAIQEFVEMPPRIKMLTAAAKWDLNFGPHSEEDPEYTGFERACDEIRDWFSDGVPTLFWDADAGFVGDHDHGEGEVAVIDTRTVKRALFGSLAEYL